ncbi:MAG: sensor domain-containing diguanylate cyclase [wastewater metagenome]|nr:sensor domain-containing diguanylate cyclase [Candidatus Loosdrechtia aerotolerans]
MLHINIINLELKMQNRELKEICRKLQEELAMFKEIQEKYPGENLIDALMKKNKELQAEIAECLQIKEGKNIHIRELEDLISFSAIMNEAIHDEALFRYLAVALRGHFEPDIMAVIMLDRERNTMYVPLAEPPVFADKIFKKEAVFDSALCTVIKTGQVHMVNDINKEIPCECIHYRIEKGGYLCLPLIAGGKTFGAILLIKNDITHWQDEKVRRLISNYIGLAALALHRLELLDIATHTNIIDEVTGVYNNRYFNEILSKQLSLAKRRNEYISLLIMGLDYFKRINDTYGNSAGDRLLQQIARILSDYLRDSGIIARYNRDKLAIIMPTVFKTKALVKADDLRRIIESTNFDTIVTGQIIKITVSIGVASFPEQAIDKETLVRYANRALYNAKEEGRNRIATL